MLNLPAEYLETYRDQIQQVTVEEIQRVAKLYVRPDEAAVIVVGDGSSILDQIKPYCENIETYTTSGKRKDDIQPATPTEIVGAWQIHVETPFGQSIPATLSVHQDGSALHAKIESEMGNADLGAIEIHDNGFHKATSIDMDGHSVDVEITASFDGQSTEGMLLMQKNSLPFSGTKL
jgi:zinc protease